MNEKLKKEYEMMNFLTPEERRLKIEELTSFNGAFYTIIEEGEELLKQLNDPSEVLEILIEACDQMLKTLDDGEHGESLLAEIDLSYEEARIIYEQKRVLFLKQIASKADIDLSKTIKNELIQYFKQRTFINDEGLKKLKTILYKIFQIKEQKLACRKIISFLYDKLDLIYDYYPQVSINLAEFYLNEIVPEIGFGVYDSSYKQPMQELFANLIVNITCSTLDKNHFALALKFIPEEITVDTLALKIAKYYSLIDEKQNALKHIEIALNLGLEKNYLNDVSFQAYNKEIRLLLVKRRRFN